MHLRQLINLPQWQCELRAVIGWGLQLAAVLGQPATPLVPSPSAAHPPAAHWSQAGTQRPAGKLVMRNLQHMLVST